MALQAQRVFKHGFPVAEGLLNQVGGAPRHQLAITQAAGADRLPGFKRPENFRDRNRMVLFRHAVFVAYPIYRSMRKASLSLVLDACIAGSIFTGKNPLRMLEKPCPAITGLPPGHGGGSGRLREGKANHQ